MLDSCLAYRRIERVIAKLLTACTTTGGQSGAIGTGEVRVEQNYPLQQASQAAMAAWLKPTNLCEARGSSFSCPINA
uniref:Uncharacterized protein n=1 Tax=mine drainage metagenome TaxID=410659 RepID=E6PPB7_9ZZZZ